MMAKRKFLNIKMIARTDLEDLVIIEKIYMYDSLSWGARSE
jgi:hypothetical protein